MILYAILMKLFALYPNHLSDFYYMLLFSIYFVGTKVMNLDILSSRLLFQAHNYIVWVYKPETKLIILRRVENNALKNSPNRNSNLQQVRYIFLFDFYYTNRYVARFVCLE